MTTKAPMVEKAFPQVQSSPPQRAAFSPNLPGNYTRDFIQAMHRAGLTFNENIIADGDIHRFVTGKKGQKDGWYISFGLAGAFGDWSRDIRGKWSLNKDGLSNQDKEKLREQLAKAQRIAEEERLRKQEETAALAMSKWGTFSETGESPYLIKKKVDGVGVRFNNDFLIIPLRDVNGKLWSLQWIGTDGSKRFLPGGRKKSCFHHMGELKDGNPIYFAEGYATGASVHMATNQAIVVAFDAGNLDPVIEGLKRAYPHSPLIIAGDEDRWKENNTGRGKAEQAAQKYGCSLVFPQFKVTETKPFQRLAYLGRVRCGSKTNRRSKTY